MVEENKNQNAPVEAAEETKNKSEKVATEETTIATKREKTLAALGYVSFLCVLPLALEPKSEFCRFHGKQGLVLVLLFFILSWISIFSRFVAVMLYIAQIIVTIIAFLNAVKGKTWKIPMVADVAKKLEI